MRIISQDGGYDLPYEETVLAKMGNTVIAYSLSDLDGVDYLTMAEYSTKEKTIKAMEMCREKYADSEYNRIVLCGKGETIGMLRDNVAEDFKDEICDKFTFRFPADEEVE